MSRFKGSKDQLLNELMEDDSYSKLINKNIQIPMLACVIESLTKCVSIVCSSNGIDVSKGRNIPGLRDANMLLIRACKSTRVPYYTNVKRLRYFGEWLHV